jgi:hypothetical protein
LQTQQHNITTVSQKPIRTRIPKKLFVKFNVFRLTHKNGIEVNFTSILMSVFGFKEPSSKELGCSPQTKVLPTKRNYDQKDLLVLCYDDHAHLSNYVDHHLFTRGKKRLLPNEVELS